MKWNTNKSGHLQLKKIRPIVQISLFDGFQKAEKDKYGQTSRRDRIAYCKVHISNTLCYNYNHK